MAPKIEYCNLLSEEELSQRTLPKRLRRAGWKVDAHALRLFNGHGWFYRPRTGLFKAAKITPRELGCTHEPTLEELCDLERLLAGSRALLPKGQMLKTARLEAIPAWALARNIGQGETLTGTTQFLGPVLQLVSSHGALWKREVGERWLYAVSTADKKRFSLDQPFLFEIVEAEGWRAAIDRAQVPKQPEPDEICKSGWYPAPHTGRTPGLFCAQWAMKAVLDAFGKQTSLKELMLGGLWGRYVNGAGHTMPWDVAWILREHGLKAEWYHWPASEFVGRLEAAIRARKLVIVVSCAQRRMHGWHNVVVNGFICYGRYYYWQVSDDQYRATEYDLLGANTLYTSADFRASELRVGLGIGFYAIEITP